MAHNTITAISGAAPSSLNPPVCAVFASIRPCAANYQSVIEFLRVEAGTKSGSIQDMWRRTIHQVVTWSSLVARKHTKERLCTSINVS